MYPRGNQFSKGKGQMTPHQQQKYLMQQNMNQYMYSDSPGEEQQQYAFDASHKGHPGDSYRSGNDFESTPGSRYSVKNTRDLTPGGQQMMTNQNDEEDNYEYSRTPSVYSSKPTKNDNFKVIIRVRPPLPREQDQSCPFRSCLHITPDNKSVSLMEYMGAEVNESERQIDIQENPQL